MSNLTRFRPRPRLSDAEHQLLDVEIRLRDVEQHDLPVAMANAYDDAGHLRSDQDVRDLEAERRQLRARLAHLRAVVIGASS